MTSKKQLTLMIEEALHKEKSMWKYLELDGSSTKKGFSVTYEHRSDIIQWLSHVSNKFQFYPEAIALAVSLLDRFLYQMKVQAKYLKCVALTCMHIASKITEEDEVVPHVADLVNLTAAKCSADDVVRMEMLILNKLNWEVNLATPLQFLQVCHAYLLLEKPDLLASVPHMTPDRQLTFMTHKLEMCMSSPDSCHWTPSMIALSLISLELEQFRSDWFPLTLSLLHFIRNINYSELIGCKESLSRYLMLNMQNTQLLAAQNSGRQQKRARHHTTNNYSKRKMVGPSPLEQDDIYASIKGLYGEQSDDSLSPAAVAAAVTNED